MTIKRLFAMSIATLLIAACFTSAVVVGQDDSASPDSPDSDFERAVQLSEISGKPLLVVVGEAAN